MDQSKFLRFFVVTLAFCTKVYINRHTRVNDKRKDYPNPKRPPHKTAPNSYRLITSPTMMWKILTEQIFVVIYFSLISHGLFFFNCRVFLIRFAFLYPEQIDKKKSSPEVSYYLDFSSLLYLLESGSRVSLVRSTLVSKVPYYLDFSSLLYLHEFGTRTSQGIAISQSYFASFIELYIGMTTSRPNRKYSFFLALHCGQSGARTESNLEINSLSLH